MEPALLPPDLQRLSPIQLFRALFSYPYCNLMPQYFSRTREFDLGLLFVARCRELLEEYGNELPTKEAQKIEENITFLELSLFDDLNRWNEYLDLFEQIFREKRGEAYIATYSPNVVPGQTDEERFDRYLMGRDTRGRILVHELYLCESRRSIIERKLRRQQEGKSVEHLKRHQKEALPDEERARRFGEMERLFRWMKKAAEQQPGGS